MEAKLGAYLYKKRIASATKGKRGGFRTLLAYKKGKAVFFVYGFGKGEKENISGEDVDNLKKTADVYLGFDESAIKTAITIGSLVEVINAQKYFRNNPGRNERSS